MGTTEKLAKFIVETNFDSIPGEAIHAAKRAIIDTFGVMLAGSQDPTGKLITSFVRDMGGTPKASVVGAGFQTSPTQAALANGIMGHVLDFDDICWQIGGHPSVTLLPSMLALGEYCQASGKSLVAAFVLGFEVMGKLSKSGTDPRGRGFHPTAIFGAMGAATIAAKVLKMDVEQTAMTLGLAASHASGLGRNRGTMTKSYHAGNAARSGVASALLVKEGWTARGDIIEVKKGFCDCFAVDGKWDDSVIAKDLGNPYTIVSPGIFVKKYPSCGQTHRCIDAMLQLIDENNISEDDVAEVECMTEIASLDVLTYLKPTTYLQGKFSLPFCMAMSLLENKVGMAQVTNEKVNDPKTRELMKRVRHAGRDVPKSEPDIVTVTLKDGKKHSLGIVIPKGDPAFPLSDDEINAKYKDCAAIILPEAKVEKSLDLLLKLESLKDIKELMGIACKLSE